MPRYNEERAAQEAEYEDVTLTEDDDEEEVTE